MWRKKHNLFQNRNLYFWIWRNSDELTSDPPGPSETMITEGGLDMITEGGTIMATEGV